MNQMNQMDHMIYYAKCTVDNFPNFLNGCAWIGILMRFGTNSQEFCPNFLELLQKNRSISGNSYNLVRFQIVLYRGLY